MGSTSVPGLVAKPIIDIMVGVDSLEASTGAIEELSNVEYCYYPYLPDEMDWFCKPSPDYRTHHVHLVPYNSQRWCSALQFRDALRANHELAAEYVALKCQLAASHGHDREAYTQQKGPFIKKVLSTVTHV